jgi:Rho guanine nucleotide exchange factor 10
MQLECLVEILDERKREAEQFQGVKGMLQDISGQFSARPLSEDNITQLVSGIML